MQQIQLKLKPSYSFGFCVRRAATTCTKFDAQLLLEAKIAFYLKESLGIPTDLLVRFPMALSNTLKQQDASKLRYLCLRSLPPGGCESIEVRIPVRSLAKELEERRALPRCLPDRNMLWTEDRFPGISRHVSL